jgi:hypothetical protein
MKLLSSRIVWGVLLIAGGLIFLLQNLQIITFGELIWALLFAFGGFIFLSVYAGNRAHWWALIPGFLLLGIAANMAMGRLAPQLSGTVGGGIFLGSLSLAFWGIYLTDRENWWAVIPGGVLLTLAVVSSISDTFLNTGAIFFLGLAATFGILAVLPTPQGTMRWALIPAGILLLIAIGIFAAVGEFINLILPLALIVVGVILLIRTFFPRWGD